MDAFKAMELIEQLETKIARMYAKLGQEFGDDKLLKELFDRLHHEELNHAHLAAMEKRIVRSKPSDFGPVDLNFSDFKQVLDYIDVVMAMPRKNVQEILTACYLIESSMVEKYVVEALRGNPEIRPLLDQLSEGFRDHLTALAAWVKQLGVDIKNVDVIRKRPRVSLQARVMLDGKAVGSAVDISEGGMFVLTTAVFPEGSTVTVAIPIGRGEVRTKALVRYSVPNAGVGLSFPELGDRNRELIQQYVDEVLERVTPPGPAQKKES